jgi:carboxylesterase type B
LFNPNPWVPVIDKGFLKDSFMPEDPIKSLKNGSFSKMPVMIGHTKDEGTIIEVVHTYSVERGLSGANEQNFMRNSILNHDLRSLI